LRSHLAFTWYVLAGTLVTFCVGSLASTMVRRQETERAPVVR
jgi:hypothetical protein